GVQGASEGIEGRAGPRVVLSRPVGHGTVTGVPLPEEPVDVRHRVSDRLFLVDHLAQAYEPRQRFGIPGASTVIPGVLDYVLDLSDLIRDHLDFVDDVFDHFEGGYSRLDQI